MARLHPDVRKLLKQLLDVIDNFERALDASDLDEGPETEALHEGVRGIHRQLTDLLYRYEVRAFTSVGARFDPARHEAMGQVRTPDVPPLHVAREVRRGYLFGDDLFRAAQVLVSAEPTAEHVPVAAVAGSRRSAGKKVAERSAPNRPSWLLNPPVSTSVTLYLMGRTSAAKSADEGQRAARDAALGKLHEQLPTLIQDQALADVYERWSRTLERRSPEGLWDTLLEHLPDAKDWVDDFYWEQVQGEIRGRAFDVAVLLALPKATALGQLERSESTERWGGLEFTDVSPMVAALTGGASGALLVETHLGGVGTRAGLKAGDIVTRVGPRAITDASSVRRLLTLSGNARRPFEVEFVRDLGPGMVLKIDPVRRR